MSMTAERATPTFAANRDTLRFSALETEDLRARLLEARAAAGAAGLWVLERRVGEEEEDAGAPL